MAPTEATVRKSPELAVATTVPFPRAFSREGTARSKIKTLDELAIMAEEAKARGRSVVLAHGVFDLVHLGHVRHLESAAREGDLLFVTVTADRYVNKGPGRPVFTGRLRAEMLGALQCVAAVGINDHPGAEEVIHKIKPSVYVKGPDYKRESDDITGRIRSEREAVEMYGGKIAFTDDLVLSSSQLINDHFSLLDPAVQQFLNNHRAKNVLPKVLAAVESIANLKVLFVGDAIIDEYQYSRTMGKAAKEAIIAGRSVGSEIFAGGVIAAANHAAGFVKQVEVITCLGLRDSYEDVIRGALHPNVAADFLFRKDVPTTRKCRFVDPAHLRKMFEMYYFDDRPIDGALEDEFIARIREKAPQYDVVVVTDFGHGLITPRAIEALCESSKFLAVNAQTNSANLGYNLVTKYPRADYVCIDAPEARLASGDRFGELADVIREQLATSMEAPRFVVTDGEHGCVAFSAEKGAARVPAFTRQVVDTVGAGDAFLAVTAPIASLNHDMEIVGLIGNAVGAMKVGTVGHRQSVEKVPLMKYITALLR